MLNQYKMTKCQTSFELWILGCSFIIWFFNYGKEVAKITTQAYQIGKGTDSPGCFGCQGAGKINFSIISTIFQK